jgi:hypothetical protein
MIGIIKHCDSLSVIQLLFGQCEADRTQVLFNFSGWKDFLVWGWPHQGFVCGSEVNIHKREDAVNNKIIAVVTIGVAIS